MVGQLGGQQHLQKFADQELVVIKRHSPHEPVRFLEHSGLSALAVLPARPKNKLPVSDPHHQPVLLVVVHGEEEGIAPKEQELVSLLDLRHRGEEGDHGIQRLIQLLAQDLHLAYFEAAQGLEAGELAEHEV